MISATQFSHFNSLLKDPFPPLTILSLSLVSTVIVDDKDGDGEGFKNCGGGEVFTGKKFIEYGVRVKFNI